MYNEAIDDFSQAIKLDPKWAKPYNNRGQAYLYSKQFQKAIDESTTASVSVDPQVCRREHQSRTRVSKSKSISARSGRHDKAVRPRSRSRIRTVAQQGSSLNTQNIPMPYTTALKQ